MVWHGDGLLRATARPAMAVLGGLTLSITVGNKGNKGSPVCVKGSLLRVQGI